MSDLTIGRAADVHMIIKERIEGLETTIERLKAELERDRVEYREAANERTRENARLRKALAWIVDGGYREEHPLTGDSSDDGQYAWPDRISAIEQQSKTALNATEADHE